MAKVGEKGNIKAICGAMLNQVMSHKRYYVNYYEAVEGKT